MARNLLLICQRWFYISFQCSFRCGSISDILDWFWNVLYDLYLQEKIAVHTFSHFFLLVYIFLLLSSLPYLSYWARICQLSNKFSQVMPQTFELAMTCSCKNWFFRVAGVICNSPKTCVNQVLNNRL